jgi:hypothetical protein
MTHIPSIQLIRLLNPPPGHDEASFAKWQSQFGDLMAELKHTARSIVARTQNPTVLDLLDAVQACRADPIAFGLVEHLFEFTAFHVAGRSGHTVAESAVQVSELLPEELRGYLASLAASHWDLYEVTGLSEGGAILLRRLHDDEIVELDALEMPQAFVTGTVQAVRIFDAGGFTAAPVALVLEQEAIAGLVSRMELEQPGPFDTRAEYMRRRGSALILRHALKRHIRRLAERRLMPEPSVSLVESSLPRDEWRRLAQAFSLLEAAVGDRLSSLSPLVLTLSGSQVMRLVQNGRSMAMMLFESDEAQDAWVESGQATAFVRVWRAQAEDLFPEDVELLEGLGLTPVDDGAVVAVRLAEGVWEDVDVGDVEGLIDACRWAAVRVHADGELAA